MNRITLTIGERVVYWDIQPTEMALIAQSLVQTFGPAEEGETDGDA